MWKRRGNFEEIAPARFGAYEILAPLGKGELPPGASVVKGAKTFRRAGGVHAPAGR